MNCELCQSVMYTCSLFACRTMAAQAKPKAKAKAQAAKAKAKKKSGTSPSALLAARDQRIAILTNTLARVRVHQDTAIEIASELQFQVSEARAVVVHAGVWPLSSDAETEAVVWATKDSAVTARSNIWGLIRARLTRQSQPQMVRLRRLHEA